VALALLALLVLAIGVSLGLSGVGGFLVAPLLVALAGVQPRDAVTGALITFVPAGLLGAVLSRRLPVAGSGVAAALCLGTAAGVAIGREISLSLGERTLQRLLAAAVAAGGLALLAAAPRVGAEAAAGGARPRPLRVPLVAAVGCPAGVLTVLAGVGGPLVTVPALVVLGVETQAAVGIALLASVVGAALGALALAPTAGDLDWPVLVFVLAAQLAGIAAGARLRATVPAARLTRLVAVTALVAAGWLLVHGSR
jgi:uncharacterized membrane protein YfcA